MTERQRPTTGGSFVRKPDGSLEANKDTRSAAAKKRAAAKRAEAPKAEPPADKTTRASFAGETGKGADGGDK
ncbi:hypothetical protein [Algiphilus sp.]|uniref:hypothetical protein n=1 Tax=Algiphilus sp. TaxID=1872431 RepID=UPI0025C4CEA0|nr:hypothetical protein [Algiphilus sp.]MCK5769470.1 hypothetical protein [Algiphilus sp.]